VTTSQLTWVAIVYSLILLIWFALPQKRSFLFYLLFSLAVTASVQLVGVYLVFASLILPTLATRMINKQNQRLFIAYLIGFMGYLFGLLASLWLDVPMGAMTVWTLFAIGIISHIILSWNSTHKV
jgi:zinc/manganese transport system permease protein